MKLTKRNGVFGSGEVCQGRWPEPVSGFVLAGWSRIGSFLRLWDSHTRCCSTFVGVFRGNVGRFIVPLTCPVFDDGQPSSIRSLRTQNGGLPGLGIVILDLMKGSTSFSGNVPAKCRWPLNPRSVGNVVMSKQGSRHCPLSSTQGSLIDWNTQVT